MMSEENKLFDCFADAFCYPHVHSQMALDRCSEQLTQFCPSGLATFGEFRQVYAKSSLAGMQEAFIQAFDHNTQRSLDIGWHLYGESYNRGAFLVEMRRLLKSFELTESTELPDHLTHTLRVLGRLPNHEAIDFSRRKVLPAVERIHGGFANINNPFRALVETLALVLRGRYGEAIPIEQPDSGNTRHSELVSLEDAQ